MTIDSVSAVVHALFLVASETVVGSQSLSFGFLVFAGPLGYSVVSIMNAVRRKWHKTADFCFSKQIIDILAEGSCPHV